MEAEENQSLEEDYEEEWDSVISYHTEDFISKAKSSENGTIPLNILEFNYSFGYDCQKRFNLCVADPNTLIFASGNLIHFFNIPENKITFRRCSSGGGIGHITKNLIFNHIAIGENGINPPLIIYEWPSMEIVTVLHAGTTRSYSSLRYSPDGLKLVSQGGDPDYLITVWDWQRSKIALQCKSHGQDIYNVVFSQTLPGRLITCGSGHIKSWKVAETFTGLKLQGELGRFGKTEISDIVSVYPMPDEKIISGCEWGNILVWAEGLIKIEVSRKNKKPCHNGYVTQFEYVNEDLISVGTDGCICFWYYETIDQATPSETSNILEVEPIDQFTITNEEGSNNSSEPVMLMQILKQNPSDPDNGFWYAQDGNGGIWLLDLTDSLSAKLAKKLMSCHAGPVMDMYTSDWGPYAVTIGQDGRLHVYNYYDNNLTLTYRFQEAGCCVIWLPCSVEPTGSTIICAFDSGVIRIMSIKSFNLQKKNEDNVRLIQVLKPHTMKITCMSMNPSNSLLVTGGEDKTVFIFQIQIQESYPNLVPIGYLDLPSFVTFMTWKPNHTTTLFTGCSRGDCMEVNLPEEPQTYTTISYKLTECKPKMFKFESVKSFIIREQFHQNAEKHKQIKIAERREELRQMIENNPGLEINEELFIESGLDADPPLPEIYIPEVPNAVLVAFYSTRDSILLSMAGYDAGYMYEYSKPEPDKEVAHIGSHLVADCNEDQIHSCLFYNNRKYIIFGLEHGEIRICKMNPEDDTDLSDYWILPMHDHYNGYISKMCLSYNKKMLLSCGYDGNIFSFYINDDSPSPEVQIPKTKPVTEFPKADVPDIDDLDHPSLEQVIVQTEKHRVMTNAKEDKEKTLQILHNLNDEFNAILKRNNSLPLHQRLTKKELELDPRITEDLDMHLKNEMDLVYRKLAFDVEKNKLRLKKLMDHFIEPITCLPFVVKKILKPDMMIHSFRELKLTGEYCTDRHHISNVSKKEESLPPPKEESEADIQQPLDTNKSSRTIDDKDTVQYNNEGSIKMYELEDFLRGLSPRTIQYHLSDEINQMLKKYRSVKRKLEEQVKEWQILESQKPDRTALNPEDESIIEHAKNTIGDYKLKASLDFISMHANRTTVLNKSQQIIDCRRKIHFRREDFNSRLRDLRAKKVKLHEEVKILIKKLKNIHLELPQQSVKPLPVMVSIDHDMEFPERNLELERYISTEDQVKETKKKKELAASTYNVDEFDEEYEVLLLDESYFRMRKVSNIHGLFGKKKTAEEIRMVRNTVPADVLAAIDEAEKVNTKLEREMKRARVARKIHEQDQILDHILKSYEAFDEELDELEKERLIISHESVYMDLFLLTLHQELLILKKFENMENELTAKVNDRTTTKLVVNSKIKHLLEIVEDRNNRIAKIQEKINEIVTRYVSSIKEDKYYSFLKKICKKKYKPQKKDDASSSSESSSSESSSDEEMDRSSSDSEEVKIIHVDENICPPGCNKDLYDNAFIARDKRYEMEFRINDEQKLLDNWLKELELQHNNLKTIEVELQNDREKLSSLLVEKQRQLNDIDVTVVLKMHQLQCFTDEDKLEKIQNCIIFDKTRLSQLYMRVGEIQKETAEQVEKYKNDKAHLRKIKTSCESMKKELEHLKEEIKKEMQQKFGQQISLVILYEEVLRRLIHDFKTNTSSLVRFYDEKIKSVKAEYMQQLQVLKDLIESNTEKLSFLTVLEEELLKLRKTLNLKLMSEGEIRKLESQYKSELTKLKTILKDQEKHKDWITKDIKMLTSKSKNLLPLDDIDLDIGKESRSPMLTVFGTAEEDSSETRKTKRNYLSRDDVSISDESKESLMLDSSEYKKLIAVRHLLSQVTTLDKTNTTETIDKMLTEITDNLKHARDRKTEIENNTSEINETADNNISENQETPENSISEINEILENSTSEINEILENSTSELDEIAEGQELSQSASKDIDKSLGDIIYRYRAECSETPCEQEIKPEVHAKLNDLFLKIGIEDNTGEIAWDLVNKLKMFEDVNFVTNYVLQKLPLDVDDEKKMALLNDIKQSLLDIMNLIEIEGIEAVEEQEDEF